MCVFYMSVCIWCHEGWRRTSDIGFYHFTCVCFIHLHVYGVMKVKTSYIPFHHFEPYAIKIGSLFESGARMAVCKSQQSSCLCAFTLLVSRSLPHTWSHQAFYVCFGELASGPQVLLPTEASPQLSVPLKVSISPQ